MTQKKANPQSKKGKNTSKSKSIRRALLYTLGVVIIVAATVIIVLHLTDDGEVALVDREAPIERPVIPTGARGTVVTEDNLDEIREALARPPEDAYYMSSMSVEWTFDRWDRPSRDAYVENSESNERTVFFDVFLDGTRELIYSSPYIPVGGKLEDFALDTEVQAGEYTATVVYFLVDDDYEVITDVSVMIWLNILG